MILRFFYFYSLDYRVSRRTLVQDPLFSIVRLARVVATKTRRGLGSMNHRAIANGCKKELRRR